MLASNMRNNFRDHAITRNFKNGKDRSLDETL